MWLSLKFVIRFVLSSIHKNFLRSLSVVFSIVLVLSAVIAILGWLDISPKIATERAFEKRGFEIKVSEIYHQPNALNLLQEYLETEEIVETTCLIHKSMFLYNLNERGPSFNLIYPIENESDFYVSKDDLSDGVFFVPNKYLVKMEHLLEFEEGSIASFNHDNSGIIISRQTLNIIAEKTNHTYSIGSKINFSIATQFLPERVEVLGGLKPFLFEDFIINGIYERTPVQTQIAFGISFYQETLGDGVFVSHDLLPKAIIESMEINGFFPSLFVRMNRKELESLPLRQIVPQIDYLAKRIMLHGRYNVEVQAQEIYKLLFYFDEARIVLLLLLLPFLILVENFYLTLIPHILNNRIEEFMYLRLRGTSDRKIFGIQSIEFGLLMVLGIIFGFLGGVTFIEILSTTTDFLGFSSFTFFSGLNLLIESESGIWVFGAIGMLFLNYMYVLVRSSFIIRRLHHLEGAIPINKMITGVSVKDISLKTIIGGLGVYFLLSIIGPIIFNEFGAFGFKSQLVPLILIILIGIWVFFSFYIPQFCLKVVQTFVESKRLFSNPRKKLPWLNLFRRRAQYISFLAILTLTISLLLFSRIYFETIYINNQKNADYVNGGDLKIITDKVNIGNFTSQINSIEGVRVCLGFPYRDVEIGDYSFRLIGVNPEDYYEISLLYPLNVIDGPSNYKLWQSLNDDWDKAIIMNEFLANIFRWKEGSTVSVLGLLPNYFQEYNFSITGIISDAPGIGSLYFKGYSKGIYAFGGFAIVHEDLLASFGTNEANTFIISLNSPEIRSSVIQEVRAMKSVRKIYSSEIVLQYQQKYLQLAGVYGILTINFIGSIFISLIGIAVFYQYLIGERLGEFAIFQAFGATKRKIITMTFLESVFLIIVGLIIGILTGYFFTLGFLITSRQLTVGPYNVFLLEITFSPIVLALALSMVAVIIIVAAVIPLKKIYSLEITNILRGE
ncbi:MAG: FtsX-like permease family protein [Candidatus Hodarchaeota archaeon]